MIEQNIDHSKVQAVTIKRKDWKKIKKYLTFH